MFHHAWRSVDIHEDVESCFRLCIFEAAKINKSWFRQKTALVGEVISLADNYFYLFIIYHLGPPLLQWSGCEYVHVYIFVGRIRR